MQTDPSNIESLIIGYIQNELTNKQISEFKRLLSENSENRELFSEISKVWGLVNYPKFEEEKEKDFESIKARILPAEYSTRRIYNLWNTLAKIAAVVFLITTCTLSYMVWMDNSVTNVQPIKAYVPKGSKSTITLPDQTIVYLNSDSKLTYYSDFGNNVREIWLEGEAYFDVTPDKSHPFLVNAGNLNVHVTGTTFNVRNYQNDEDISIALVSGKVNISTDKHSGKSKNADNISMNPNQLLTYNKSNQDISTTTINALDRISWIEGSFRFHALTFEKIAKELERIFNVTIDIRSNQLKNETFTGSFSDKQTFREIFHEINVNHKYKWVRKKNIIIITKK